jgi:hypothetical protein
VFRPPNLIFYFDPKFSPIPGIRPAEFRIFLNCLSHAELFFSDLGPKYPYGVLETVAFDTEMNDRPAHPALCQLG